MILNLLRHSVLAEYLTGTSLKDELGFVTPFLGISVNLQRAYFQAFGRRSAAKPPGSDADVDASCAADYLNHLLFCEFLKALEFVLSPQGSSLAKWMGISKSRSEAEHLASEMAGWRCWYGYYKQAKTIKELLHAGLHRIDCWRQFLNTAIDSVPKEIWKTKTLIGEPLHYMGNLLQAMVQKGKALPLYVVIDQYEVLPELNPTHGTSLQRIVNTLIKARDPVVFYRIGARTYDWGKELRVRGAESRIELQRDYVVIDLAEALMRNENTGLSTFRDLATDVVLKRLREGNYAVNQQGLIDLFAVETPRGRIALLSRTEATECQPGLRLPSGRVEIAHRSSGRSSCSPLDMRLAAAWTLQRVGQGQAPTSIQQEMATKPWITNKSWRKERIQPALFQIASLTRSKKHYAGWTTIVESQELIFLHSCY